MNRMISDDDTSTAVPKMPSSVWYRKPDQARDVVAAVRPRPGSHGPDEARRRGTGEIDEQHDPARRAAHRLEHEQHEHDAEERCPSGRAACCGPRSRRRRRAGRRSSRRPAARSTTSHHIRRLRKRFAIGKSRNTSSSTKPTWTGPQDLRRHDVDRRVEVEQRHADEQRRRRAGRASRGNGWSRPPLPRCTPRPSAGARPRWRRRAARARRTSSAQALLPSPCAGSGDRSARVAWRSVDLDALVPRNTSSRRDGTGSASRSLLVLELDVLRLLVHGDQVGFFSNIVLTML